MTIDTADVVGTMDVVVIGTDPPCPRCDLMSRLVEEAAGPNPHVRLKHCSFDSPEAKVLGQRLGCKIGTAKHVAVDAGIAMDWDFVYQVISRKSLLARPYSRPADAWTPELDAILEPCRAAAESLGYLMTPVLVINGRVKHHGNVPSRRQIVEWVIENSERLPGENQ